MQTLHLASEQNDVKTGNPGLNLLENGQQADLQSSVPDPQVGNGAQSEQRQASAEELLTEVQELRLKIHQDSVMTKRKALMDRTAWAFLAGMTGACAVALMLVYTNYMVFLKWQEARQDALKLVQEKAAFTANAVSPQTLVQLWKYPGAQIHATSSGSATASSSMKTNDSYAAVWKYYADKAGYMQTFTSSQPNRNFNGGIPGAMAASWSSVANGHPANNRIESRNNGGHPMTFLTRHSGPNTETILLRPSIDGRGTEISVDAMNAW